jgi:hypothetical protein
VAFVSWLSHWRRSRRNTVLDGRVAAKQTVDLSFRNHHTPTDAPRSKRALGEQGIDRPQADPEHVGRFTAIEGQRFCVPHAAPPLLPLQCRRVEA